MDRKPIETDSVQYSVLKNRIERHDHSIRRLWMVLIFVSFSCVAIVLFFGHIYCTHDYDKDVNHVVYDINGNSLIQEEPITARKRGPMSSFIHLSFDDVQYCIKNLATHSFNSVFDEPFLGMLKDLHDGYGTVFSLYLFQIENSGLLNISDRYQQELTENAHWLKFGFHQWTTGALSMDYETAKSTYERFISAAYNLCGGINSIDRMPRLDYYGGSLETCQGLRDAKCGIVGLLTASGERTSYYLSEEQAAFLHDYSVLYDMANGLSFIETSFLLDWFVDGYSSTSPYDVPVKSTPYEELIYRYNIPKYGDRFQNLIVFTHEWQVYDSSYRIKATMKDMIEQVCRFGMEYGYDFDYPMYRVANITSLAEAQ